MSTLVNLEVHVTTAFESYYGAVVFVDGVKTSLDCGHNHHKPEAATKCLRPTLAKAKELAARPDLTEVEMKNAYGERMVEFGWTEMVQFRFSDSLSPSRRTQRVSFDGQPPRI